MFYVFFKDFFITITINSDKCINNETDPKKYN